MLKHNIASQLLTWPDECLPPDCDQLVHCSIWWVVMWGRGSAKWQCSRHARLSSVYRAVQMKILIRLWVCSEPLYPAAQKFGWWGSAFGIAIGYGLECRRVWVWVPIPATFFSIPCSPDWLWRPHSLQSNWYQGLLPLGVERPRREAGRSTPTSAEVKNTWIYTSTPPYVIMT
jgi:hypothetical protein